MAVDPIRYEVFAHRLWAVGEEGRIALQRVSASPIVVQGGECMSSFLHVDIYCTALGGDEDVWGIRIAQTA